MTRERPDRVLLVGYYGVDNLGDDAIRDAVAVAARELHVPIVATAVRPGRPLAPTEVRLDLAGLHGYLRAIRAADRVVLGGGGILKDEGLRLILDLVVTAVLARAMRRRLTLLTVGVGPLYGPLGTRLVRLVARLAHVRTVRDAASADALQRLGVGGVVVGADPVFSTPPVAGPVRGGDRGSLTALVSVRPWFFKSGDAGAAGRFRAAVATGLRVLLDAGVDVRLASLYRPRDRDEGFALRGLLGDDPRVTVLDGPEDWAGLLAEASRADVVIAMRYHALAAAAVAGRPALALAYEPKVASLAEQLGIPVIAVDAPDIADRLEQGLRGWAATVTTPPGDPSGVDPACVDAVPAPPGPGAVDALRARSLDALRRALLD